MKKRLMSFLLAMLTALSLLPLSSLAAEISAGAFFSETLKTVSPADDNFAAGAKTADACTPSPYGNITLEAVRELPEAIGEAYARLDYIESTGTQYIDTGFSTTEGMVASFDCMWLGIPGSTGCGYMVGSHNTDFPYGRNGGYFDVSRQFWELGYGETFPQVCRDIDATGQKCSVTFSTVSGNAYLLVNGEEYIRSTEPQRTSEMNVCLFYNSYSMGLSSSTTQGRLYSASIWDKDGVLVRDFVPVLRLSDRIAGMYDTVTEKFYPSETNPFVYGAVYKRYDKTKEMNERESKTIGIFRSPYEASLSDIERWSKQASSTWVMSDMPVDVYGNPLSVDSPFYATVKCTEDGNTYAILLYVREAYSGFAVPTKNASGFFKVEANGGDGGDKMGGETIGIFRSSYAASLSDIDVWAKQESSTWSMTEVPVDACGDPLPVGSPFFATVECTDDGSTYAVLLFVRETYDGNSVPTKNASGFFKVEAKGTGVNDESEITTDIDTSKYTVVPYIESNGMQAIDTGLAVNVNDRAYLSVDVSAVDMTTKDGTNFAGADWYLAYTLNDLPDTGRHKIEVEYNCDGNYTSYRFLDNHLVGAVNKSETAIGSADIGLCSMGTRNGIWSGLEYSQTVRVYGAEIIINGKIERYFVPVHNNETHENGLYDYVTGTFYANALGNANFSVPHDALKDHRLVDGRIVKAPTHTETGRRMYYCTDCMCDVYGEVEVPVIDSEKYRIVAYIESDGSQAIDTGLHINKNDSGLITMDFQALESSPCLCSGANYYLQFSVNYLEHHDRTVIRNGYIGGAEGEIARQFVCEGSHRLQVNDWRSISDSRSNVKIGLFSLGDMADAWWMPGYSQVGRLYGCEITLNNKQQRYFVPVVETSTGKAGLLDLCENKFYPNVWGKTENCPVEMTNLLSTSKMYIYCGAIFQNGVFTFPANTFSMIHQELPTPIVGHQYYGRVEQKVPAGTSIDDARFEYYVFDEPGTGHVVFTALPSAVQDDQWHTNSSIQSFTGLFSASGYYLRSFNVNSSNTVYRRNHMIIDLTEAFGAGNEPTVEWCDQNIPFFEGTIGAGDFGIPHEEDEYTALRSITFDGNVYVHVGGLNNGSLTVKGQALDGKTIDVSSLYLGTLGYDPQKSTIFTLGELTCAKDGKVIMHLLPKISHATHEVGLYDTVNHSFYALRYLEPVNYDAFFEDSGTFNPDILYMGLDIMDENSAQDDWTPLVSWENPPDAAELPLHTAQFSLSEICVFKDGEAYHLYFLNCRGTASDEEWKSNLTLGNKSRNFHEGFETSADFVLNSIKDYLSTDKAHNKLIAFGYSRGAAIASIVATKLMEEEVYFTKDNAFVYTVACPNYSTRSVKYNNIFHIDNNRDVVTMLPAAAWRFHKEGVEIMLPDTAEVMNRLNEALLTYQKSVVLEETGYTGFTRSIENEAKKIGDIVSDISKLTDPQIIDTAAKLVKVIDGTNGENIDFTEMFSLLRVVVSNGNMFDLIDTALFFTAEGERIVGSHTWKTYYYWTQIMIELGKTCSHIDTEPKDHICDLCGTTISRHTDTRPRDHICDYCGMVLSECTDADGDHWCDYCGKEDTAAHTWDGGVITAQPTCKDKGIKTYTCTVCGKTKTEVISEFMSHVAAQRVAGEAATCGATGTKEYWYCPECGKYFSDSDCQAEITEAIDTWKIIPVIPHTPSVVQQENIIFATASAEGSYDEVVYCYYCHTKISSTHHIIPKIEGKLSLSTPAISTAWGCTFTVDVTATQTAGEGGEATITVDVFSATIVRAVAASKKATVTVSGNGITLKVTGKVTAGEKLLTLTLKALDELPVGATNYLVINETFNTASFKPLTIYEMGDVNMDGKINSRDAVMIQQYAVKMITLTPEQLVYADVFCDGKINSRDAVLIQQYAVKMPVELGGVR